MHVTTSDRIGSLYSSGGNQLKWSKEGKFIKLNSLGYEDIAEWLVSKFLSFTDLDSSEYVKYYLCNVYEDGKALGLGCYSYNFVGNAEEYTVRHILEKMLIPLSVGYDELIDIIYDVTGINFTDYIDKILYIDAIIRNDDRHFGNIVFLHDSGVYYPAPIFDNGSSLMSDTLSYPLDEEFNINYKSIMAKPFKTRFEQQIHPNCLIRIRCESLMDYLKRIELENSEDDCILRAIRTLRTGLYKTEGLVWERV